MSEASQDATPGQAVARASNPAKWAWISWDEVRQRFKDLLVVFFGVYAAFLINRWDADRRDSARRHQLLEALEHEVSTMVDELKTDLVESRAAIKDFDRKLAGGEMPGLGISYSNTAYSASDDATLLQAGGLELLDVETLDQLRKVNQLERSLVESVHNNFQLELTLLGTHEKTEFYDQATRQLNHHYSWYPVLVHNLLKSAEELLVAEEQFLVLIRARKDARAR